MPHDGSPEPIVLAPLPYAVGIIPSFCISSQKTLAMKERIWTIAQDSLYIHDERNVDLLQCTAKDSGIDHQKLFYDMQSSLLWSLRQKPSSSPRQYYGEGPDGQEIFQTQGDGHSVGGAHMTVTFTNTASNNEPIELQLSGNWIDRHCTITWNDRPVAQITKGYINARQILGDPDMYYVTIAPGMDVALIASICVVLDERDDTKND